MPEFVGRSLGRYRIVELLGAGGMGEVYRARDSTLDRDVAIKVLSDAITQNPKHLERFQREARSLAQLSHPNILAIHDFRTDEGITYAVEELLEGRDLHRVIGTGPVSLQRAIDIVCSVAEGLGAAHRKGIIHRDVKPGNIFELANGGVKILDFGLARSFDRHDTQNSTLTERSELTSPGSVVGTASYMSPEQARGEELGPASDVFSLGVVFYELLTGVHPFRKENAAETTASILREDPVAPSAVEPNIPPAIDAVVGRCLEKRSDERFESARDIAFALKAVSGQVSAVSNSFARADDEPRRWGKTLLAIAGIAALVLLSAAAAYHYLFPPPLPDIKRITVARFEADGDDPELKFLAAGLSEVVAAGLEIVAEESPEIEWVEAWRLKKRRPSETLRDAYRDFSIRLGVVGRVALAESGYLLILEVVNPNDDSILRTARIEDSLLNPLAFQVKPVVQLVSELGVEIDDGVVEGIRSIATDVPPALEPFLMGLGRLTLADSAEDAEAAFDLLRIAADRDGFFLRANTAAARACLEVHRLTDDSSWLVRALEILGRLTAAEPPPVEALLIQAKVQRAMNDEEAEAATLRRAIGIYPNHGEARRSYAAALRRIGLTDEAEQQYQRAIYLQPSYWPNHHWLAGIYASQGLYEAAATQYRRVVDLAPKYAHGYTNLGATYIDLGRQDLAREVFESSLQVDGVYNYASLTNLGAIYEQDRRFADAESLYEKALSINDSDYRVWGNLGWARQISQGVEAAEDALRRAVEMAETELEQWPDDAWILCDIAGYCAALGEEEKGIEAVNAAASLEPTDPELVARVAEAYEDLGDRDRALEWVERAFDVGVSSSIFEDNLTLRDLVADERYPDAKAEIDIVVRNN